MLTFNELLKKILEDSFVDDKTYESLHFLLDNDYFSKVIWRDIGISQESQQRAKILSHSNQVHLRKERIIELNTETI